MVTPTSAVFPWTGKKLYDIKPSAADDPPEDRRMLQNRDQLVTYRHRLMVLAVLVCSTLLSLGLIGVRWAVAGHPRGAFLVWNLFLAWVPFWFALALYAAHLRGTRRSWLLLMLG